MSAADILWIVRAMGDVWAAISCVALVLCAMVYRAGGTREGAVKHPFGAVGVPPLWAAQIGCWLWWLRPAITAAMAAS